MQGDKGKARAVVIGLLIAVIVLSLAVAGVFLTLHFNPRLAEKYFAQESLFLPSLKSGSPQEKDVPELELTDADYLADTVFVGDSRTHAMDLYGYADVSRTIAEDGLNHQTALTKAFADLGDGNLYTLYQALRVANPKRVYVGFGINGMSFMSEEDFFSDYRQLLSEVESACPKAQIVILSIYPVGERFSESNPGMSNERIDDYNRKLKVLASELGIHYVDAASVLKSENGALNPAYGAGDGLHLNASAYDRIFEVILSEKIT